MKKVLVIGDAMIDEYIHVDTERTAQEADIPVYDIIHRETRLGGAGNVAANIKTLDDKIHVTLSCVADGEARTLIMNNSLDTYCSYGSPIKKTRVINSDKIVVRLDTKKTFSKPRIQLLEEMIEKADLSQYDVIVISDYDKGTITKKIAKAAIESDALVVVDSKRFNLEMFEGADFLNINELEYSVQRSNRSYGPEIMSIEQLFNSVIVTKGPEGSKLISYEQTQHDNSYIINEEDFKTLVVDAVDVTGCGDTHTAAFTVGILRDKLDIRNAVRYANIAASIAVTKQGTAKITKWDCLSAIGSE